VVVSWRRPVIGGLAFIALGLAYVFMARAHLSWILAVACPLLLVGALFLLSSEARSAGKPSGWTSSLRAALIHPGGEGTFTAKYANGAAQTGG
jgi:cell division protein FtsW (lipid II flippase)